MADLRSACTGCPMRRINRRQFLGGCAAGAAAALVGGGTRLLGAAEATAAGEAAGAKPKVRLVYTYVPSTSPIWPNIGYDFDARKKVLTDGLTKACPGVEFLPATINNGEQAKKLLAEDKDKDVDGYLVFMLGLWTGAPQAIGTSGKPTLFVDDLYGGSGEFLIANASARRNKWKVAAVSSSRLDDVVAAARCFELLKKPGGTVEQFLAACQEAGRKAAKPAGDMACKADAVKCVPVDECLKKLQGYTILAVGGGWGMPGSGKAIEALFGTKVLPIEFKELHETYVKADRDEARKWAEKWTKGAEKVVEPSKEDIENSGAMYLAMLDVLKRHNAQAITINCLGGFYGGQVKAFPCLGFCQLNDDGMVGACEGDLTSTITMLAVGSLLARPGMISDPVIDTSKNQIIYAHCVAPTKVFGREGAANAYHIRSHSEDRKGASMRSLLPLGYMTTTVEINASAKQILLHQGKTVENVDEDKACRTKLAAEPKGDLDKLLTEWDRWGWHRVTFYGDVKEQVTELAKALKMTVVEEA
jgi:hypothetical protein